MSLDQHVPFEMTIRGYPCRVWYRGQSAKCVICKSAHKAAECPDKNKCRRTCGEPGHVAKDCTNTMTPHHLPPPLIVRASWRTLPPLPGVSKHSRLSSQPWVFRCTCDPPHPTTGCTGCPFVLNGQSARSPAKFEGHKLFQHGGCTDRW